MAEGGTVLTAANPQPASSQLRVSVRSATPADAPALEGWFASVWCDIRGGPAGAGEPPGYEAWLGQDSHRWVVEFKQEVIGIASTVETNGEVVIEELGVRPASRNRGLGAEAVYTIEARAAPKRARVPVPITNGLAIYFWLRVGYRPLFSVAGVKGATVMVRDLG